MHADAFLQNRRRNRSRLHSLGIAL
jgi:hypothetical protein